MGNYYPMLIRRASIVALLLLLVALGHQWVTGSGGLLENRQLRQELAEQITRNEQLIERNEVARDWLEQAQRPETIEAHARSELGMVRNGETLFWVVEGTAEAVQESPSTVDGNH